MNAITVCEELSPIPPEKLEELVRENGGVCCLLAGVIERDDDLVVGFFPCRLKSFSISPAYEDYHTFVAVYVCNGQTRRITGCWETSDTRFFWDSGSIRVLLRSLSVDDYRSRFGVVDTSRESKIG